MKPWTHARMMRMYVCSPSILPVYGTNGQETAQSEYSWNWIKSILCSRSGSVTPLASSWFRQCLRAHDLFLHLRYADILVIKSRRLSHRIRIVRRIGFKSSGLSDECIAKSRASGWISLTNDTDTVDALLIFQRNYFILYRQLIFFVL